MNPLFHRSEPTHDLPIGAISNTLLTAGLGVLPGGGIASGVLSALIGSAYDKYDTKLPVSVILTSNIFAGVAAAGLSTGVSSGVKLLEVMAKQNPQKFTQMNIASDALRKFKNSSLAARLLLSKPVGIALLSGITYDTVHKLMQDKLSDVTRRVQVFQHKSSIIGNNRVDKPKAPPPIVEKPSILAGSLFVKQSIHYQINKSELTYED